MAAMPVISKSDMIKTVPPNWYRGLKTRQIGEYFGSDSSIAPGETYVTMDHKNIVYRDMSGLFHVSRNACAHAGAQLLKTAGVQDHKDILCPLHQWRYDLSGNVIAAPFFEKCPSVRLHSPVYGVWNGFVLGYPQEQLDNGFAKFGQGLNVDPKVFNPGEYEFMEEVGYDLPYPCALMKINYMDGLHVYRYHMKTFTTVADVGKYLWDLSQISDDNPVAYSIQEVSIRGDVGENMARLLKQDPTLSPEELGWARLHLYLEQVLPRSEGKRPVKKDVFAYWAAYYGNSYVMPEVYENGLLMAVSYLVNVDPKNPETGNRNFVEYYVHKSVPLAIRDVVYRLFKKAYEQSAREDDEICEVLWQAHSQGGLEFNRVYHEELEKGDLHFRTWFMKHFSLSTSAPNEAT